MICEMALLASMFICLLRLLIYDMALFKCYVLADVATADVATAFAYVDMLVIPACAYMHLHLIPALFPLFRCCTCSVSYQDARASGDTALSSPCWVMLAPMRGVANYHMQERDWYYASLPRISTHDKGKEPLEENEPVRGNPVKETVELICGDVDFLVQLRDKKYYIPGQPWTATASQIIDLLSDAHSRSFEELLTQQQEHGIVMVQPSSSLSVVDSGVVGGAVLAQFYSLAKSTCWVRPFILVNGVWTPLQGNDFWRSRCRLSLFVNRRQVPESVVDTDFVPHGLFIEPVQYWGAAPSLIKTWGWARVCTDIVRYSMFGCLRPVRKDVCRDIVVYSLAVERIPASFRRIFQQVVYTVGFVGYFSDSDVQCIPEFDSTSSDGSTVYRSPSPQVEYFEEAESVEPIAHLALGPAISGVAQEEQSYFVASPESPPPTFQRQDTSASSSDSPMHFNSDDIPLDDTADVQTTFPAVTIDLSPLLYDLKISLSKRMDDAQSDILSRLRTIERGFQDTLGQKNEYFRNLIQSAQQDWQNQDDIQTLRFNAFQKVVLAQGVTAGADSVEVRKELKALDAKINSLDGQLSDLVEYIRGGDAKKGEGSSRRRPLPPPVNQDMVTVKFNRNNTIRSTAKVAVNRDVNIRVTRDRDVIIKYRYRCLSGLPCWHLCLAPTGVSRTRLFSVDCGSLRQSGPRPDPRFLRQAALEALTRSARTDSPRRTGRKQISGDDRRRRVGGGVREEKEGAASNTCVTLNGSGIQLAVGPQPLRLRNHNSGLAQRIMVKRLATSPHDPLGITDSACKNQLVVVSVQYGPFNPYIPIRSTTIGKSRVTIDPIAMHTSWRSE
ncbi:hypothetical protein F511_26307 [Dorcoceras hygrometricum]|uniref:Uncharacterized protein n=1 Tax=Dorcoceras hygrometricum TaxID=472368 RepID=A0A2Z7AEA0_9LAMI|nr:hypothetical protein F511_26307 [Dorcoceras hygrometricum]